MASVWVVERGEYSDYKVLGVFSTPELAQRAADAANFGWTRYSDEATVEEWPLDPMLPAQLLQGFHLYMVRMTRDGQAFEVSGVDSYVNTDVEENASYMIDWSERRDSAYVTPSEAGHLVLHLCSTVWARDEQHAVKIVNEQRAQMIASGEWDRPV